MTEQTKIADVERKTPTLSLPDAMSTAEVVINQAVEFCAQKMGLEGREAVLQYLQRHDGTACGYCCYSVAKQVAEALGALDQTVKAVYVLDYDATPEDIAFADETQRRLIHLITRVARKTSALQSLVEGLDRALAQSWGKILGMPDLKHILDVQLVDEVDVEKRVGYGALLSSLYQRPIKVWER